ncbi:MAG TPA: TIGR03885 family FMN-dependent LLM class oxidoreductase [Gemmatimonadaceae bacterium]|nr:TIGR03885 family FMN-dependent LLM class oxidoreductase [Gemmatimonadaceae bacterium]
MTRLGYHVSHEQHAPSALLEYVRLAEQAGFDGALSSDHFHPWLEENGQSGFGWSWLGAALATTRMTYGTVCAPGDRYHPAIIAQAAATLAEMFPERFWLAVGTGEAANEHITGEPWPSKPERKNRLRVCVKVIRALWNGETVTHRGLITVEEARLYTLPKRPPMLIAAAVSDATAAWAGSWADGLITTGRPRQDMTRIMDAFRRGGGEGKPVFVQHVLSWDPDEARARQVAHEQWRFAALDSEQIWNTRTPREFAVATRNVTVDEVAAKIRVSSSLDDHRRWIADYVELGVDRVFCFNVGLNQREYIEAFGEKVLPQLR